MKTSEPDAAEVVICERPELAVAVIRIDRPERRNALSLEVKRQLDEAFTTADAEPDVLLGYGVIGLVVVSWLVSILV